MSLQRVHKAMQHFCDPKSFKEFEAGFRASFACQTKVAKDIETFVQRFSLGKVVIDDKGVSLIIKESPQSLAKKVEPLIYTKKNRPEEHDSSCHYLFGKGANDVFPRTKSPPLVNLALETMIEVSEALLLRKEAYFLTDPVSHNNQCHMFSLMAVKVIQRGLAIQSATGFKGRLPFLILSYAQDIRFLHLSFSISFGANHISEMIKKEKPKTPGSVLKFLKDPYGERTKASRETLSCCFEGYVQSTFTSAEGPLYKELTALAALPKLRNPFYTLPKLAGVIHILEAFKSGQVLRAFKCKMVTPQGGATFVHFNRPPKLPDETPVVLFEMLAVVLPLTIEEVLTQAVKCPFSSRTTVFAHPPTQNCLFCQKSQSDLSAFETEVRAKLDVEETFLGFGADFVEKHQPDFVTLFKSFALLNGFFERGLRARPKNFNVVHAYTTSAKEAAERHMMMEATYSKHLTERGLI